MSALGIVGGILLVVAAVAAIPLGLIVWAVWKARKP